MIARRHPPAEMRPVADCCPHGVRTLRRWCRACWLARGEDLAREAEARTAAAIVLARELAEQGASLSRIVTETGLGEALVAEVTGVGRNARTEILARACERRTSMRADRIAGKTGVEIAARHGVSPQRVSQILAGEKIPRISETGATETAVLTALETGPASAKELAFTLGLITTTDVDPAARVRAAITRLLRHARIHRIRDPHDARMSSYALGPGNVKRLASPRDRARRDQEIADAIATGQSVAVVAIRHDLSLTRVQQIYRRHRAKLTAGVEG